MWWNMSYCPKTSGVKALRWVSGSLSRVISIMGRWSTLIGNHRYWSGQGTAVRSDAETVCSLVSVNQLGQWIVSGLHQKIVILATGLLQFPQIIYLNLQDSQSHLDLDFMPVLFFWNIIYTHFICVLCIRYIITWVALWRSLTASVTLLLARLAICSFLSSCSWCSGPANAHFSKGMACVSPSRTGF